MVQTHRKCPNLCETIISHLFPANLPHKKILLKLFTVSWGGSVGMSSFSLPSQGTPQHSALALTYPGGWLGRFSASALVLPGPLWPPHLSWVSLGHLRGMVPAAHGSWGRRGGRHPRVSPLVPIAGCNSFPQAQACVFSP